MENKALIGKDEQDVLPNVGEVGRHRRLSEGIAWLPTDTNSRHTRKRLKRANRSKYPWILALGSSTGSTPRRISFERRVHTPNQYPRYGVRDQYPPLISRGRVVREEIAFGGPWTNLLI